MREGTGLESVKDEGMKNDKSTCGITVSRQRNIKRLGGVMPRSGISQATNNGLTKLESCGKAEIVIGWRRSKRHMGNTGIMSFEARQLRVIVLVLRW